jgi:hypothetical protein
MDSNKTYAIWDYKQGGYITVINNKRYIGANKYDGIQFNTYDKAVAYIQRTDGGGYNNDRYDITPCIKE